MIERNWQELQKPEKFLLLLLNITSGKQLFR